MQGCPALPPIHLHWEQEKSNLIEWFGYLWVYQGGQEEPNWDKIMANINDGQFQYIKQKHLLAAFLLFTHPKTWGKAMMWLWS
ncbi:hypothetical protein FRC08_017603 [Ceratobasidium sp. 394]|nr:hypothetical protein FRC08_017603 [Ceratobasidium sp. 394]